MFDVVIVGGGPVGLFLGGLLAHSGRLVRVLETQEVPTTHSRAIGIHPPSLELLGRLGVVDEMIGAGVAVRRGQAFGGRESLGTLDFATLPGPYPFVLTLPQSRTEGILTDKLTELEPEALQRGARVVGLTPGEEGITIRYLQGEETHELDAAFVVGCDGKESFVRESARIPFRGGPYPDTYLMGDFTDNTRLGTDAGLYLTREGLVESFPLPGGVRRWVAKTERYLADASPATLAGLIERRTGHTLPIHTNTMLSAFGVQRFLAQKFFKGRLVLAGDAAHVLSPIGGQGMNLGWGDANSLDGVFTLHFGTGRRIEPLLELYHRRRHKVARTAITRAEFNMMMGRKSPLAPLRNAGVRVALRTPLTRVMARVFTMHGLS